MMFKIIKESFDPNDYFYKTNDYEERVKYLIADIGDNIDEFCKILIDEFRTDYYEDEDDEEYASVNVGGINFVINLNDYSLEDWDETGKNFEMLEELKNNEKMAKFLADKGILVDSIDREEQEKEKKKGNRLKDFSDARPVNSKIIDVLNNGDKYDLNSFFETFFEIITDEEGYKIKNLKKCGKIFYVPGEYGKDKCMPIQVGDSIFIIKYWEDSYDGDYGIEDAYCVKEGSIDKFMDVIEEINSNPEFQNWGWTKTFKKYVDKFRELKQ